MTKLMEWLFVATIFFAIWITAVTNAFDSSILSEWRDVVIASPVILVTFFGLYAAAVVLYRVFNFNNCEGAAKELQRQIEEAKAELRIKGVLS